MVATPKKVISVLPLENGDRLSRCEFERRYQAMPHLRKAANLSVAIRQCRI